MHARSTGTDCARGSHMAPVPLLFVIVIIVSLSLLLLLLSPCAFSGLVIPESCAHGKKERRRVAGGANKNTFDLPAFANRPVLKPYPVTASVQRGIKRRSEGYQHPSGLRIGTRPLLHTDRANLEAAKEIYESFNLPPHPSGHGLQPDSATWWQPKSPYSAHIVNLERSTMHTFFFKSEMWRMLTRLTDENRTTSPNAAYIR